MEIYESNSYMYFKSEVDQWPASDKQERGSRIGGRQSQKQSLNLFRVFRSI